MYIVLSPFYRAPPRTEALLRILSLSSHYVRAIVHVELAGNAFHASNTAPRRSAGLCARRYTGPCQNNRELCRIVYGRAWRMQECAQQAAVLSRVPRPPDCEGLRRAGWGRDARGRQRW